VSPIWEGNVLRKEWPGGGKGEEKRALSQRIRRRAKGVQRAGRYEKVCLMEGATVSPSSSEEKGTPEKLSNRGEGGIGGRA